MRAINLKDDFISVMENLSSNKIQVSEEEISRILNYCDVLSTLNRGQVIVGDENIKDITIATFMLPLVRPRLVSWDTSDWDMPNQVCDKQKKLGVDTCLNSDEFNSICAKIAKKLKFSFSVAPIEGKTNPVLLSDHITKGSIAVAEEREVEMMQDDGTVVQKIENVDVIYVPTAYNYDFLPVQLNNSLEMIVGENFYVKELSSRRFVEALFTEAVKQLRKSNIQVVISRQFRCKIRTRWLCITRVLYVSWVVTGGMRYVDSQ